MRSNPVGFVQLSCKLSPVVRIFVLVASAAMLAASSAFPSRPASPRIHLVLAFAQGQTFRYGVQMRIATASAASGPIKNAGGPQQLNQTIGVVIRLDVLSASAASSLPAPVRIRATYEQVNATNNSPAYDPDIAAMEDQYKKLSGESIEFTLQPDGKISDVTGLNGLASDSNPSRAALVNQWLSQLTLGASLPKQGIAIGEKWSSEQPLANVPLDGLSWKSTATYLRNEACPAASQPSQTGGVAITPAPSAEQCAVILTRSEIVGGSDSKDRTPEVFRQNGLSTFGIWTGNAESLTSVSLRTGLVSSVTQSGSTHMDFTIMTTHGQNRMRYAGETHTQSEITLLSSSALP